MPFVLFPAASPPGPPALDSLGQLTRDKFIQLRVDLKKLSGKHESYCCYQNRRAFLFTGHSFKNDFNVQIFKNVTPSKNNTQLWSTILEWTLNSQKTSPSNRGAVSFQTLPDIDPIKAQNAGMAAVPQEISEIKKRLSFFGPRNFYLFDSFK